MDFNILHIFMGPCRDLQKQFAQINGSLKFILFLWVHSIPEI